MEIVVPIEVSARHVHLQKSTFEKLFGKGANLTLLKNLSQPGNFAAQETVTLRSAQGQLEGVRILGPLRTYDQVEISKTDARKLKLDPHVRDSHELKLAGTPGLTLIGPRGRVALKKGLILPWRHIHMNNLEALEYGLESGQLVKVDIDNNPRSLVFENVLVRVSPDYKLAMHIDTDEGNAAGIDRVGEGRIIINGTYRVSV